jgi:protein-L-isoaspartate(D-aspartate) O-methyltransferase
MVEHDLKGRDITDKAVLQAMGKVPRHLFVPPSLSQKAYADHPLPIGEGQTISQPYVVALMTQAVSPKPGDIALEIGTGSGYQAAVLSEIVKKVYTIEIVPELAKSSSEKLMELGYKNIFVRAGDGFFGWPEHAPFDLIIVTAAAREIPEKLIEQLKKGGKLIMPIGPENEPQHLTLLTKQKDGTVMYLTREGVRFVPMTGEIQRNKRIRN